MFRKWLIRLAMVLPATVAAVLLASSGGGLPFEARMLAGAVTFSAIVTARDHKSALVRGLVSAAIAGIAALIARA
jgi:hypothetical protein